MNIVITGASRGIGYQTAKILAERGNRVIATARSREGLSKLHKERPDHIEVYPADLTDPEQVSDFTAHIMESFPYTDVLVNNAGGLLNKPFGELELEDWKRLMDINLYSPVRLIRALADHFSSPAHIVNISSMGGYQGSSKFPGLTAYSVSKGALATLSECLAAEYGHDEDKDIRVNALCLGAVQTEMLEEAFPGFDAPVSAGEMGHYIADFAVSGSTYYNGKVLPVALSDPG